MLTQAYINHLVIKISLIKVVAYKHIMIIKIYIIKEINKGIHFHHLTKVMQMISKIEENLRPTIHLVMRNSEIKG